MTVLTLISCDCSGALWVPRHQASKVCTNLSIASFPVFFPWSSRTAVTTDCCGNLDTRLQVQYSFLHCQIGLNKARAKRWCKSIRYLLEANFASEMGPCTGQLNHLRISSMQLPTLNFWQLSCEHPRTLARDNTGICTIWTWAGFTTSTWLVTRPVHHYTHVHPCTLTCTKST